MSVDRFGPSWCASGARNFFGEGWWFHWIFKVLFPFCFTWRKSVLVAKTTTLNPRSGRMPLKENHQPKEWIPRCIYVNLIKGFAFNAVGLSGPGAVALFQEGRWQRHREPFQISFSAQGETVEEKVADFRRFVELFLEQNFRAFVMLQVNFSCPNTENFQSQVDELLREIEEFLDVAAEYNIQIIPKLNALFPPKRVPEFGDHPACAAICCSNTIPCSEGIPWLPEDDPRQINWQGLLGNESPLKKRGLPASGGLSGEPLKEIVCEWIRRTRTWSGHINGCGGIMKPSDVDDYFNAGADSVSLGSIAFLRPWRMWNVIRRAHKLKTEERSKYDFGY